MGSFDQLKEDVKRQVNLYDLVKNEVVLQKSGQHYKGKCPFHKDDSPSFFIFTNTNTYYCFGCGATGDVIQWVIEREGLLYLEALREIALRNGIKVPDNLSKNSEAYRQEQKKQAYLTYLKRVILEAAKFYSDCLEAPDVDEKVFNYALKRGLRDVNDPIPSKFYIGYAPIGDNRELIKHMSNVKIVIQDKEYPKVTEEVLDKCGLVVKRESDGKYFDRYRGRLMFPIFNEFGLIVSFGARLIDGLRKPQPGEAKYLNGNQTELFDKSSNLYGLYQSKDAIKESGQVILVEGYLDVIKAHQKGYRNVVAVMGTSISESQIRIIKKYAKKEIIFCMDGDTAGQNAVEKMIDVARNNLNAEQGQGVEVKIVMLPDGKDPDEFLSTGGNLNKLIQNALPIVDFYFHYLKRRLDISTARGKSELIKIIAPLIWEVNDRVRIEHYVQMIANAFKFTLETTKEILATYRSPKHSNVHEEVSSIRKQRLELEDKMLAAFIKYLPISIEARGKDGELLDLEDFTLPENITIFEKFLQLLEHDRVSELGDSFVDEPQVQAHYNRLVELANSQPTIENEEKILQSIEFWIDLIRSKKLNAAYKELCSYLDDKSFTMEDSRVILTGAGELLERMAVYK